MMKVSISYYSSQYETHYINIFIDKQYQTVEEGVTTDTGDSSDGEIAAKTKNSSDDEDLSNLDSNLENGISLLNVNI